MFEKIDPNEPLLEDWSHVQRWSWATPASAWSMCWPQPVHVALPHWLQVMREHMLVLLCWFVSDDATG
jgi:hypothetical protein